MIFSSSDRYYVLSDSLAEEEYAVGFRKGGKALRDRVQGLMREMKADGTLGDISEKWFGSDITIVKLDNMIRDGKSKQEIYDFLLIQSAGVVNITSKNFPGLYGYFKEEYIDGTLWVPDDDYVPTERPWYIDARAAIGRVAVVYPYVDAQSNTVTITLSKTLCDARSVAAMDLSLNELKKIIKEVTEEGGTEMEFVLDRK